VNINVKESASLLRALGEDTRLRIVGLLLVRERCVTDLVAQLKRSQPMVSHHIKVLKQAGILQNLRKGNQIFYRVNPQFHHTETNPKGQVLNVGFCHVLFPDSILHGWSSSLLSGTKRSG
jgi:DNA-binding transcriptional ArsR family regulator